MTALIIILVLVGIAVMYVISTQRELVKMDELCQNALSQIGVQLTSRWDLIQALVKMVEKYSQHEHDTLQDVIAQRVGSPVKTAADVNNQEKVMMSVIGRIQAVAEQYPDLKAIEAYQNAMGEMKNYEENVRKSRMIYNDTATKMNRMVRQFPSNLVANLLHFGLREYLQVEEQKKDYPAI